METDALIAKFTTDRKKDLADLREYFEGNYLEDLLAPITNGLLELDDALVIASLEMPESTVKALVAVREMQDVAPFEPVGNETRGMFRNIDPIKDAIETM